MQRAAVVFVSLFAALAIGCDRRVERIVPGEEPATPDLSRIFPPEAAQPDAAPGAPGMPAMPPPPPGAAPAADAGGQPIRGTIAIASSLAERAPAGASLFVFARGADGGPPVAAKRVDAPRFPLAFELGPQDRMGPARPFSGPFQLTARLDADGNATTRSAGDLQGEARGTVQPGEAGVEIVLDQVL